ncbi:hypothetical protein Pfo_002613 [Paulownia fortunei]|nr:hypothetical protein Pfo_002613 [Paulownia fortunei]
MGKPARGKVNTKSSTRCFVCSDGKTRADRKFEKKVHFYEFVRSTVAQKGNGDNKKVEGIRSFFLLGVPPSKSKPAEFKLNCKRRNNLVLKESNQLKTVINHSAFESDPGGLHIFEKLAGYAAGKLDVLILSLNYGSRCTYKFEGKLRSLLVGPVEQVGLILDGILIYLEIRWHEELLAFPSAFIPAVQGRMLVDAPKALGAPGPHRKSPEEAIVVGVYV